MLQGREGRLGEWGTIWRIGWLGVGLLVPDVGASCEL